MLRQRQPRQRDEMHLRYVRAQPCCVCGSTRNVEAAHLKLRKPEIGKDMPGMSEKADDRFTTPLCHYHHQSSILSQHKVGEKVFWFEIHGRNPFEIAERLWIESGGAARAQEPKPAKQPRKIKARDRSAPKRKIPSREIQSRGFERAAPQHSATRPIERRT
jgi:hypothetical protein